MRIDLYTLKLFVAVMETKSLTRAAAREHIAASAISKRISDLEAAFDLLLFERRPTRLEPTRAAEVLLRHANTIHRNVQQLEAEMSDLSEGARGVVRIAASIAVVTQYLPPQLRAFAALHPGVVIELTDTLSSKAVQLVVDGQADVGIFGDPFVAHGLRSLPYIVETLVAVLPPGHELLAQPRLSFADMIPFDFVCLRSGSSLNTLLVAAAERLGQSINRRVQVSGNEALCVMVEMGMGIGVLPAAWLESHPAFASLQIRPLDEPWARRRLHLCFNDDRHTLNMPTQLLVEHLRSRGEDDESSARPGGEFRDAA
ncbi:MAG TPA: LysR family transcriptional regulator [Burkholderiaceae bacterium]|jgi:DNA-binding transcriptional LysR family regulator